MSYIEMYVAPAKTADRAAFEQKSAQMAALFRKHGALDVVDCWGTSVPDGKLTSFPMSVQLEENETVVAGWIKWLSQDARNDGWEAAMADSEMGGVMEDMPLDGARMIFAGFSPVGG